MTIVQRVNAERLVLLGWSRAILMQLAHPLVAAGVLDHSGFRGGAAQAAARLHHTVGAMLSLAFGDESRRAAAIGGIRAIHRRVNGTLRTGVGILPAGTPYSAEDPALLLWVHATLLDSNTGVYERLVAPLTTDERDRICDESVPILVALGGDPETAPRTWATLQEYVGGMYGSGILAVSPDARDIAMAVLSPRAAGIPLPLTGLHRVLTTGLLPGSLRHAYGLPWSERHARRFERAVRLLRRLRRVAPPSLAYWADAPQRRLTAS
jgi:uncharacterized protein (DUF2236 family)